jgi:thiamine pyrophosphokinase
VRVLGVLDGNDMPGEQLAAWARSADLVIAADGAADKLHSLGLRPHVAIGDFDAISPAGREAADKLVHVPSQEASDCDKLLSYLDESGRSEVTLANVEGDLPDHVLATYHSALRSRLDVRFAFRRGLGFLLRDGAARRVDVPEGCRVSLIPLLPCSGVSLRGVCWPLDRADLAPGGATSLSNHATEGVVEAILPVGAAMLCFAHPDLQHPIWETNA